MRSCKPVVLGNDDHDKECHTDEQVRAPQDVELERVGVVLYPAERVGDHVEVHVERQSHDVCDGEQYTHLE